MAIDCGIHFIRFSIPDQVWTKVRTATATPFCLNYLFCKINNASIPFTKTWDCSVLSLHVNVSGVCYKENIYKCEWKPKQSELYKIHILQQKSLVSILIRRFFILKQEVTWTIYEHDVCISTLFNKLISTELYTLTITRLFKKILLINFIKCTCNTCSEKLIRQIKYKLSKPKAHVPMNKKSSL